MIYPHVKQHHVDHLSAFSQRSPFTKLSLFEVGKVAGANEVRRLIPVLEGDLRAMRGMASAFVAKPVAITMPTAQILKQRLEPRLSRFYGRLEKNQVGGSKAELPVFNATYDEYFLQMMDVLEDDRHWQTRKAALAVLEHFASVTTYAKFDELMDNDLGFTLQNVNASVFDAILISAFAFPTEHEASEEFIHAAFKQNRENDAQLNGYTPEQAAAIGLRDQVRSRIQVMQGMVSRAAVLCDRAAQQLDGVGTEIHRATKLLLARMARDLNSVLSQVRTGHHEQALVLASSIFEASHQLGALAARPSKVSDWLNRSASDRAPFESVRQTVDLSFQHLLPNERPNKRKALVNEAMGAYHEMCAFKHVNPSVLIDPDESEELRELVWEFFGGRAMELSAHYAISVGYTTYVGSHRSKDLIRELNEYGDTLTDYRKSFNRLFEAFTQAGNFQGLMHKAEELGAQQAHNSDADAQ